MNHSRHYGRKLTKNRLQVNITHPITDLHTQRCTCTHTVFIEGQGRGTGHRHVVWQTCPDHGSEEVITKSTAVEVAGEQH